LGNQNLADFVFPDLSIFMNKKVIVGIITLTIIAHIVIHQYFA